MATIQKLMRYLEQGYTAVDLIRIGPAYLRPRKQDDSLVFVWTAYGQDGSLANEKTYTQEQVSKWQSDTWGILLYGEVGVAEPERIDQAIADGLAHKADGF